jgi:hypothetical protein
LVFESGRQVGLNQTSLGILMRDWGDNTDTWLSRWVVLSKGEGKNQYGDPMDILKVEPDNTASKPAPGKPPPRADMDDEIPF